jgi:hypothetical protein
MKNIPPLIIIGLLFMLLGPALFCVGVMQVMTYGSEAAGELDKVGGLVFIVSFGLLMSGVVSTIKEDSKRKNYYGRTSETDKHQAALEQYYKDLEDWESLPREQLGSKPKPRPPE